MALVPLINGIAVSWAQITISFLGVPLTGVREITYTRKQEKTNNYGAGIDPVSRGYGRNTYEGNITLLAEEWKNIRKAAPGNDPTKIPFFDFTVLYIDPNGGLFMKDVIKNVDLMEDPMSSKEGDTMIEISVPFIFAGKTSIIV